MTSPRVSAARRMVALKRFRPPNAPDLIAATQEHAFLSIEEHVAQVLASTPPLRPDQIERLRALFQSGAGEAA